MHQLQLYACTYRQAVRRTVKKIILGLGSSGEDFPSEAAECRATIRICELLDANDAAIQALQQVPLHTTHVQVMISLQQ